MSASQPSILRAVFILSLAMLCGAVILWAASHARRTQPPDRIPAPLVIRHLPAAHTPDRHAADAGWDEFRMTGTSPMLDGERAHPPVWCFGSFDVGEEDLVTTACFEAESVCRERAAGEARGTRRALPCVRTTTLWCFESLIGTWSCHLGRSVCTRNLRDLRAIHAEYRDGRECERRWARGP